MTHPRQTSRPPADTEDLDLRKALELSLAESRRNEPLKQVKVEVARPAIDVEEDDADLKAAIEASLREAAPVQAQDPYSYPKLDTSSSGARLQASVPVSQTQQATTTARPTTNPHEIQQSEQENIRLFATLVDHLTMDAQGSILRDPKIQELYESISTLRPKLARSLGDTIGKYESLVETHAKLTTVVKYYDRMLEARLASTYNRGQYDANETYQSISRPSDPYSGSSVNRYSTRPQETLSGDYLSDQAQNSGGYAPDQNYYQARLPHSGHRGPYEDHFYQTANSSSGQLGQPVEQSQPKEEVSLIDL